MKKKKKYTLRKFINDIHLWLGIASGIILFLVCLSGTLLVFQEEIEAIFTEEISIHPEGEKLISIENLKEKLSEEGLVTRVTLKEDATLPYEFTVKTSPKERHGSTFFVDQYTGEYQKEPESSAHEFMMTMFKLHRWLLLEVPVGRPIVGVATIIFFFISISGIVLWFPKKMKWKNFKPGFKIKFSANWKRINHDLHNTLGFYACVFLIIMCLTGLCWSFEWYREASSAVIGTKVFNRGGGPSFTSDPDVGSKSLNDIITIGKNEFNYQGDIRLNFPKDEKDVYSLNFYDSSNFSPVTSDELVIGQNGEILHKEIFSEKAANVQIASLIKPIHTGQIFGNFSKIIYFLACLIATSLPITGTIIWINKLKKKSKKKKSRKVMV
ncbi:PepSY-associated TM helix domain-containing protein [Mesonia sp.]|uniref:PepSY-associated TM helix domain-containing protein n=1 Tax=Mesonia sp. TaxID=1960830 RepID=UPI0017656666|nr:PepSY-associated TM helix domain-containing protein [Mesonia sp.]HIB36018.1 PepSY domain-containing protein [Mesonia sp.]HIO26307.1 PepSY domain-containing protein [Flavobacteriaceae bacterium]